MSTAVVRRLVGGLLLVLLGSPAVAADPGTLVVLNKAEATASLIDLAAGEVAATLPTGSGPHEVAISPDGRLAVSSNYGTRNEPGSTLTVLDIPTARVVRTIDLGSHRRPHGVAFLAGSRRLAVTAEDSRALLTVDLETGEVQQTIETGQEISHMLAVTPDGRRAFVANIGSGSVTAIDLEAGRKLRDIPTGDGAEGIAVTPDGRQVWVTNREADTLTVLDAGSLAVLDTLPCTAFPIRIQITPDGRRALVSNARSGDVAVFDVASRKETARIPLELSAADIEGRLFGGRFGDSSVPIGIVIHPGGRRAWVAHANADRISVLDLDRGEAAGRLRAGREPDGMGYSHRRVGTGETPR